MSLEVFDSSNFQGSSGDFKVRNFPRYVISGKAVRSPCAVSRSSFPEEDLPRSVDGVPRRFGRSPSFRRVERRVSYEFFVVSAWCVLVVQGSSRVRCLRSWTEQACR